MIKISKKLPRIGCLFRVLYKDILGLTRKETRSMFYKTMAIRTASHEKTSRELDSNNRNEIPEGGEEV